jgi:hypothetical protein
VIGVDYQKWTFITVIDHDLSSRSDSHVRTMTAGRRRICDMYDVSGIYDGGRPGITQCDRYKSRRAFGLSK